MRRFITLIVSLLFTLSALAITVKIENPSIDVNATDSKGNSVIKVNAKLTVSGIKGENFDLVAVVKDDEGRWHKDASGELVKNHYTCNAPYERTVWKNISVNLHRKCLAPLKGKHSYKVYLYVRYGGKLHNLTYAGTYTLTGSGNSSKSTEKSHSHTHSSSNSKSKSKTDTSTKIICTSCNGVGYTTCLACMGNGGTQYPQISYYPTYSYNYVWVACTLCSGTGKLKCLSCNGVGSTNKPKSSSKNNSNSYNNYNYSNGYNNSYNNSYEDNNSSSSYTKCSTCGGTGVCTSCHGQGGSWEDTGYYIGEDSKSWIACPSCNGSKKCFMCYGRGKY